MVRLSGPLHAPVAGALAAERHDAASRFKLLQTAASSCSAASSRRSSLRTDSLPGAIAAALSQPQALWRSFAYARRGTEASEISAGHFTNVRQYRKTLGWGARPVRLRLRAPNDDVADLPLPPPLRGAGWSAGLEHKCHAGLFRVVDVVLDERGGKAFRLVADSPLQARWI